MYSSIKAPRARLLALGVCHALASSCILIPVDEVRREPQGGNKAFDGGGSGNDVIDASVNSTNGDSSRNTDRSSRDHSANSDSSASSKTEATSDVSAPPQTSSTSEDPNSEDEPTGDATRSTKPTNEEPTEPACGLLTSNPAVGVYVSLAGADNDECGRLDAPCQTLARALSRAEIEGKNTLYVAGGTYAEHIALTAPISLIGGWMVTDGVWSRECPPLADTTIVKSSTSIGLRAEFTGTALLQSLTIESKSEGDTAGESRYGVFATGSNTHLELIDVTVKAASADDGTNGADGLKGADGLPATSNCEKGDGSDGADVSAPLVSETSITGADSFSTVGYVPRNGIQGENGNPGQAGQEAAEARPVCTHCAVENGICKSNQGTNTRLSGGANGCGGGAGTGGSGGTGGGSSVGVFLWHASLHFGTNVAVVAGDGGKGGAGGTGGTGGTGSLGGAANQQVCNTKAGACSAMCPESVHGNPGNKGGNGSAGAPGGAGGWSVGIASTSGGFTGKPLIVVGQAGASLGLGAAGQEHASYPIP